MTCKLECAEDWETAILDAGPETVAAVIAEPVVGAAGGMLMPKDGYSQRLREICDKHGVLLILDDVITGIGRNGEWFAAQWSDVVPDILMIGKGLSAGYAPMAGVVLREPLVETMRNGSGQAPFGHTFSGNPLSAATCLAVLDYMMAHDVLENVRQRGRQLGDELWVLQQRFRHMADVRGRGLLWGFEFVQDPSTGSPPDERLGISAKVTQLCRVEGLIIYPAGVAPLKNALLLSPPLTISADEVETLLAMLDRALVKAEAIFDCEL